jgi:hypothetical protein
MSSNKGITSDGFSDCWFKDTERRDLLMDWWNSDLMQKLNDEIFSARLIPLNKVWPEIPKQDQFRPIVVVSPVIKWLESRFLWKIKEYLLSGLDKN